MSSIEIRKGFYALIPTDHKEVLGCRLEGLEILLTESAYSPIMHKTTIL